MISRIFSSTTAKPIGLTLWVIFFCYSCCAALIFQKILLPIISPETAGTGLLPNDAAYFHEVASKLALEIREFGWSRWEFFPAQGASGNVAILALFYALFGNDPAFIIPINAAIHALGGILIFMISRELSSARQVGIYAGIIAATLFVIFPSSLNWYGQLHKDGYAIAGLLMVFLGLLRAIGTQEGKRALSVNYFFMLAGVFMVGIVRPYTLKLLFIFVLILLITLCILSICKKDLLRLRRVLFLSVATGVLAVSIHVLGSLANAESGDAYLNWTPDVMDSVDLPRELKEWKWRNALRDEHALENQLAEIRAWHWSKTDSLLTIIDSRLEQVARTRLGLIAYGIYENAGSMLDINQLPDNAFEVIAYLPRALQIASFAPFPNAWFDSLSPTRLVATAETLIYYICLPGVLLLLLYNPRNPAVWMSLGFVALFLTVHGFTIANLGTLYRLRYAYEFILIALGLVGWATWISKSGRFDRWLNYAKAQIANLPQTKEPLTGSNGNSRKSTITSSLFVMVLTLVCFLGFFARDIMMANTYGFGPSLDYFYIALMLPMFLVTILAMPLGSAFVPYYLELKERFTQNEISLTIKSIASFVTLGLLIVCIIIYLISPTIYGYFYSDLVSGNMDLLQRLSVIALPLLLLSGAMILGNSILNANGEAVFTSMAQLVVPLVAVLALLLFGEAYGVVAVLYGMVIGQILNLGIVQYRLRHYRVIALPVWPVAKPKHQYELHKQYWPLVGSSLFIGIATPVATFLAMTLSDGAVSVFNLGNKVVLFVTGLLGAVVTTVMLPYFSKLIAKNNLLDARRELSFFLLLATFIAVPLSVLIYMSSASIVDLMLSGGNFDLDAKQQVMSVMQYSVVQLPFFVCNALLLRFAISTKHVVSILAIAAFGLIINVLTSMLLMKHMGVAGIALGGSIAMLLSTVMLAMVLVRYWHITLLDLVIMLLNWLIFITLLVALYADNMPSVYIVLIAYLVLMAGYLRSLIDFRTLKLGFSS